MTLEDYKVEIYQVRLILRSLALTCRCEIRPGFLGEKSEGGALHLSDSMTLGRILSLLMAACSGSERS